MNEFKKMGVGVVVAYDMDRCIEYGIVFKRSLGEYSFYGLSGRNKGRRMRFDSNRWEGWSDVPYVSSWKYEK